MTFADITRADLGVILLVIAFACLLGAAYTAYLRNVLATGLLLIVAVVAFLASS